MSKYMSEYTHDAAGCLCECGMSKSISLGIAGCKRDTVSSLLQRECHIFLFFLLGDVIASGEVKEAECAALC